MVCFKKTKGIARISRDPKLNTDRDHTPEEQAYEEMREESHADLSTDELRDLLEGIASRVQDGMQDWTIEHILKKYEGLEPGEDRHVKLQLTHRGIHVRGSVTLKNQKFVRTVLLRIPEKIMSDDGTPTAGAGLRFDRAESTQSAGCLGTIAKLFGR